MSIEDKILDKFPEFSDIKNDELQQKAIATVIEALELGDGRWRMSIQSRLRF